jgi:hypothetical protein
MELAGYVEEAAGLFFERAFPEITGCKKKDLWGISEFSGI